MSRVAWTDAAVADLREIHAYLTETIAAVYAQSIIETLILATDWLLEHPGAGQPLDGGLLRKWKPRRTRYILIYQPTREGIAVLRVRHERNDWRPTSE